MNYKLAWQAFAVFIAILGSFASASSAAVSNPRVLKNISYQNFGPGFEPYQTLDLYLPPKATTKPPLLAFIPGGFWTTNDGSLGESADFAAALSRRNLAVAVVRHRLAPVHRHPAPIQDSAAALAYLMRNADKYGYNSQRLFIAGHANGAHTATLLALDEQYLAAHSLKTQSLAGVIGLNGMYDLVLAQKLTPRHARSVEDAFGGEPNSLEALAPARQVRADAPPFLLLNTSGDFLGAHVDARKFADALRARGHARVEQMMIAGRDSTAILEMGGLENQARSLILNFVRNEPLPPELASLQSARRLWQKTAYSTLPFWKHADLIQAHPVDGRFMQRLVSIYGPLKHELIEWPLETFYAIDLFAYVDRLYNGNRAASTFLVTKNLRNEKQFWTRADVERHRPVLVVGLDDERNMFRFTVFYRMLREYSWQPSQQPPVMARPLGAFIHFLNPPPVVFSPQSAQYGLTHDSFQIVDKDSLEFVQALPKPVAEALTFRNGCVYCHTLRGVGSRAHHVVAATSGAHGGYALALEEYPADVWQTFIYRPEETADRIGAIPNSVSEDARDTLYRLIVESRGSRSPAKR